jgi:hypothetical protein
MIKRIMLSFLVFMLLPVFNVFANQESKISIGMEYIVVSPNEDGSTQITTRVSYKNDTDQEYKGDGQSEGVLQVTLPDGATELSVMDKAINFKQTETGFITTDPVPANETIDLYYSYKMKQGQDIAIPFNKPVASYQVLVPEGAGSVDFKDAKFTNMGLLAIGEKQNFWGYSIENIQENQTVTLFYDKDKQPEGATGQAAGSTSTGGEKVGNVTKSAPDFHNPGHLRMWEQSALNTFNPHILMIVLGAILIAGIGYFSYFKLKNAKQDKLRDSDQDEKAFKLLLSKQKTILDKIIELEETFENGQISEDDYHAKLGAYKQHLVQVKVSLSHYVD